MPFVSRKPTSCTEYDEKLDLCFPCSSPRKRTHCSELYTQYKNAATPAEELNRRVQFYQANCVAPECYDTGHCQYLQAQLKKVPSASKKTRGFVNTFCQQSRKNVFLPREYDALVSATVDELGAMVRTASVVPHDFKVNVLRVLDLRYTETYQLLTNAQTRAETHQMRLTNTSQQLEKEQDVLPGLEREWERVKKELERVQGAIRHLSSDVTEARSLLARDQAEIEQHAEQLEQVKELVSRISAVGELEEPPEEEEEDPEEEDPVDDDTYWDDLASPPVRPPVTESKETDDELLDQAIATAKRSRRLQVMREMHNAVRATYEFQATREQAKTTQQRLAEHFFPSFRDLVFVSDPNKFSAWMETFLERTLYQNPVSIYMLVYFGYSTDPTVNRSISAEVTRRLITILYHISTAYAPHEPQVQRDWLDFVWQLEWVFINHESKLDAALKIMQSPLAYSVQYTGSAVPYDLEFIVKKQPISALEQLAPLFSVLSHYDSIICYRYSTLQLNKVLIPQGYVAVDELVDMCQFTNCYQLPDEVKTIQEFLHISVSSAIINTREFAWFFREKCTSIVEYGSMFIYSSAYAVNALMMKDSEIPRSEILRALFGTYDIQTVYANWGQYVQILDARVREMKPFKPQPILRDIVARYLPLLVPHLIEFSDMLLEIGTTEF